MRVLESKNNEVKYKEHIVYDFYILNMLQYILCKSVTCHWIIVKCVTGMGPREMVGFRHVTSIQSQSSDLFNGHISLIDNILKQIELW